MYQGFRIILKPELRRYVIIPFIANCLLFSIAIFFAVTQLNSFLDSIIPDWLDWLEWLIWPIFAVVSLFVSFYTFTIVANLFMSPFNSLLSEKILTLLNKDLVAADSFRWKYCIPFVLKSMKSELYKLAYVLGLAIPIIALSLFPFTSILSPFFWILYGVWCLALEYCDYPLGNQGLPFKAQRLWVAQRKKTTLSFSFTVLVATFIPIVNFIVMPSAVAGATLLWMDQQDNDKILSNKPAV